MLCDVIQNPDSSTAGAYSPAVKIGDFLYLSGQIPVNPKTKLIPEGIEAQTRQLLENMNALLQTAGLDLSYLAKVTVFLADIRDFEKMNQVYQEYFQTPYPARSCVAVSGIVKGALIEADGFAIDTRAIEAMAAQEEGCGGCDNCEGCAGENCGGKGN